VSHEGDDAEVTETAPILEVMRRSGLVLSEEAVAEGEQTVVEDMSDDENEEDNSILSHQNRDILNLGNLSC
jgi:hypothetical protein